MTDQPVATNHASEDQHAANGGSNVRIHLVAADAKYISAIAIAVSVACVLYTFDCSRSFAQATYWLQRNESFLEQLSNQGIKVPCDLRPHNKECKP